MNMLDDDRKKYMSGSSAKKDEKRMGYKDGRTVYGEEEGFNIQEAFRESKDMFIKDMVEAQLRDVKNTKDRDEYIILKTQDRNKVGERLGVQEDLQKDIQEALRELAENENPMLMGGRQIKNEGGSLLADDMTMMPENMEMSEETPMESDDDMEEKYLNYILGEALSEDEEDMLMSKLEQDGELSLLFDKVLEVAQEFAGSGPIEGPGTGVSDSIPARLSDGEFVFTAKAVEEIGEDTLMSMMKEAEVAAEKREGFFNGEIVSRKEEIEDEESDVSDDMRTVNPRMNPNSR